MEINKIYNENCLDTMAKMPDNFIDLTVLGLARCGTFTHKATNEV